MRYDKKTQTMVLSERNLLALITKLYTSGSQASLETMHMFVKAETDEIHYGQRDYPPGYMHPTTEQFVAELQEFLRDRARVLLTPSLY